MNKAIIILSDVFGLLLQKSREVKVMEIDVSNVKDSTGLHLLFKSKLDFPGFYGMNWDAFWDAITGLIDMPDEMVIKGWKHLEEYLPRDSKVLMEIIADYNKQSPGKKIRVEP